MVLARCATGHWTAARACWWPAWYFGRLVTGNYDAMEPIDGALQAGLAGFKRLFVERAGESGVNVIVYGFPQPDPGARAQDFYVACEGAPRAHRQIPTAMLMRLAAGEKDTATLVTQDIENLLRQIARQTRG